MIQSVPTSTDTTPCPVCKIDRRGRFVFINDEFESAFGYSAESLHGKAIGEYVDEQSLQVIENLLCSFSHCQSSYDATKLVLIDKDQNRIQCHAIFTLNFIGGNPANFQMILLPVTSSEKATGHISSVASRHDPVKTQTLDPADSRFLGEAVTFVQGRLVQVMRQVGNIGHRFYNRLGKGGNRDLQKLNQEAGNLNGLLDSLKQSVIAGTETTCLSETDLGLVIKQTLDALARNCPQSEITGSADHLGKIQSDPDILTLVLTEILTPMFNNAGTTRLKLSATCDDISEHYALTIELSGANSLLNCASDVPVHQTFEWLIASRLLGQLGGTLDVPTTSDGSVRFSLWLPIGSTESELVR